MKKNIFILLAVAFVFTACYKHGPAPDPIPPHLTQMIISFTKPGGALTTFKLDVNDTTINISDSADNIYMKWNKNRGLTIWQGTEKVDSLNYSGYYADDAASFSMLNINYDPSKCPLPSIGYKPENVSPNSFSEYTTDSLGNTNQAMNSYSCSRGYYSDVTNVQFSNNSGITRNWVYNTDSSAIGVYASTIQNGLLVWLILCYEQVGFSSFSDLTTSIPFTNSNIASGSILFKNGLIDSATSPNSYTYTYVPGGNNGFPIQQMTITGSNGETFTLSFSYVFGY